MADISIAGVEASGLVGEVTNRFVTVSLYSDNAGAPGDLIAVLGTIPDFSVDTLPTQIRLSLTTPITLTPNTRYWIQLSDTSGSAIQWAIAGDTSGIGVASESTPYQMQVLAEPTIVAFGSAGTFVSEIEAVLLGVTSIGVVTDLSSEQVAIVDGVMTFTDVADLTVEIDATPFGVSAEGFAGEATNRYVTVSLYSDNDGVPGDLIVVLGIIPDSWVHGTTSIKLTLAIPVALDPNTRYWIQLSDQTGTQIEWAVTGDASGTNVADQTWDSSGVVGDNTTSAYQMRVLADQSSGVPSFGEVGSVGTQVAAVINGTSATGFAHDVAAVAGEGKVVFIDGTEASGATEPVAIEIDVTAESVTADGEASDLAAEIDVGVTGVTSLGAVSDIPSEPAGQIRGAAAEGDTGVVTAQIAVGINGAVASGAVTGITGAPAGAIAGVTSTVHASDVVARVEPFLASVTGTTTAQTLVAATTVTLTGVDATSETASVTPLVAVVLHGVTCFSGIGNIQGQAFRGFVEIDGVSCFGALGDLKFSKRLHRKPRSGLGSPYKRSSPITDDDDESLAEKLRRWRESVEDALELKPRELETEEKPVDADLSFLALLDHLAKPSEHAEPIATVIQKSRMRLIAESEDEMLLGLSDDDDAQLGLVSF